MLVANWIANRHPKCSLAAFHKLAAEMANVFALLKKEER